MSIEKQDVAIQLEYERLRQTLSGISAEKLAAADNLIQRCAFMTITLQILEDEVKSKGPTILMHNGKQTMRVENPAHEIIQHDDQSIHCRDGQVTQFATKRICNHARRSQQRERRF